MKVNGSGDGLAELRMDRLNVVGPQIEVDQGENTAFVEGDGFMQMENTTDFQGNPLKKPELLTVHWDRLMRFDGNFAEFAGNIQAQQANSRLTCQTLQVYFDKPVTLGDQRGADKKERPKGEEPARAKKMVCDRSVKVEEETYEVRYRVTDRARLAAGGQAAAGGPGAARRPQGPGLRARDRFIADVGRLLGKEAADKYQGQVVAHATYRPAPRRLTGFKSLDCLELMVENLDPENQRRPGVLRIVQPGGGGPGAALGSPAPKKEPAKPAAKPGAKPTEDWTLTIVTYGRFGDPREQRGRAGRMDADNNTHTAVFYEDVQVLHIPWTSDPKKLASRSTWDDLATAPARRPVHEVQREAQVIPPRRGRGPRRRGRRRQARDDRHRPGLPQGHRRQGPGLPGERRRDSLLRGERTGHFRRQGNGLAEVLQFDRPNGDRKRRSGKRSSTGGRTDGSRSITASAQRFDAVRPGERVACEHPVLTATGRYATRSPGRHFFSSSHDSTMNAMISRSPLSFVL